MTPVSTLASSPLSTVSSSPHVSGTLSRSDSREEKVGAEFESVLVSMLISNMRKSSFGEGLFPGDKSDTWADSST